MSRYVYEVLAPHAVEVVAEQVLTNSDNELIFVDFDGYERETVAMFHSWVSYRRLRLVGDDD